MLMYSFSIATISKTSDVAVLLANSYEPGKHEVGGWWVSEKLDGVRALWKDGRFWSRAGNEFFAPAWFKAELPKDKVLDGELFLANGQFQKCVGVVKKNYPIGTNKYNYFLQLLLSN